MYLVDFSSKLADAESLEGLLAETAGVWEHFYDEMDETETLWVFAPNEYRDTAVWPVSMVLADAIRDEAPFSLKNLIVRYKKPSSTGRLQSVYESILLLVKDQQKYQFNKDKIRIAHVYEGNEWGDRETGQSAYHDTEVRRYNPDGKDPGNVWVEEVRSETDDETVDQVHPISRREALTRCVLAGSADDELIRGLWVGEEFQAILQEDENWQRDFDEVELQPERTNADFTPYTSDIGEQSTVSGRRVEMDGLRVHFQSSEDMSDVESGSVQSIITSPPYWNLKDYGHEAQIGTADESYDHYHERMKRVWAECYDVLSETGTMWIVVDTVMNRGDLRLLPQHIANNAEDVGFEHWDTVVWYKPTAIAGMSKRNVVNKHEYIISLSKTEDVFLNTTPDSPNGTEDPAVLESGALGNLFRHPVKRGTAGQNVLHKAPYPQSLIDRLVRISTELGDTVLDPFLGSGTTAKSALEHDRDCIGYELNEEFEDVLRERLGVAEEDQQTLTEF
ncbi:DNA-methyltransferase [Halomicrococcus sp. SG-WS-1]|uniref:DNA-methyltransferase n=1 Tax=Halomicrococcus sp. SG-WS-1 TaxID=3439057 RepID=UPI003F79D3FE